MKDPIALLLVALTVLTSRFISVIAFIHDYPTIGKIIILGGIAAGVYVLYKLGFKNAKSTSIGQDNGR